MSNRQTPTLNGTGVKVPARRTLTAIAIATAAAGVLAIGSPPAGAQPISQSTIRSECKAAGGTYSSFLLSDNQNRISFCRYKDIHGNKYTDGYTNGEYTGTDDGW